MAARRLILAVLFLSLVSVRGFAVSEGERLALLVKPSVVRVADGYIAEVYYDAMRRTFKVPLVGFGSGAFIDPNGYIATNAHVTQMTHDGEEAAKKAVLRIYVQMVARAAGVDPRSLTEAQVEYVLRHTSLQKFRKIQTVITPSGDSLPFDIKAYGAPVGEGKDVCIIKVETKNAPILKLGEAEQMHLQDHVTVVGYPAAADTDMLDEKSSLEASITDGKVSARKATVEGAPVLQISAPATHGNSGGPVLDDQGDLVGLLTFRGDEVNGQEVQGFTFVVTSGTVQEFVKQAGANNTFGPVDTLWREGLDLFAQQKYKLAIEKFEEVRRLYPRHSEAERLITESQQEISAGRDKSTPIVPILLGIGFVLFAGFALVVVLVVVLMRRGKKPAMAVLPQNAQAQNAQPQNAQPRPDPAPARSPQLPIAGNAVPSDKTISVSWLGSIHFTGGALAGQWFEIGPNGLYIGRDPSVAQIVINDGRVSKRHAWVGPRNGKIVVVDVGSTNGTFLNVKHSARIQETAVAPNDVVILSDDVARFQIAR